jgi:hypothetical protein
MMLQRLGDFAELPEIGAIQPAWSRFYRDYSRAEPEFAGRSFADGGILDNKPFSYATQSLAGTLRR